MFKSIYRSILLMLLSLMIAAPAHASFNVQPWPHPYLSSGDSMVPGQYLVSDNGAFFAILEANGNFVVYKGRPDTVFGNLWQSSRTGQVGNYFAILQSDGNFVVYHGTDKAHNEGLLWNSLRSPAGGGPFFLILQGDGNLVTYHGTGPKDNKGFVWASGRTSEVTWAYGGKVIAQADRNYLWYGKYTMYDQDRGVHAWLIYLPKQRWVHFPDGSLRPDANTTQCLGIEKADEAADSFVDQQPCNGSKAQEGWHFEPTPVQEYDDKGFYRLFNSNYPKGCVGTFTRDGVWIRPYFYKICPPLEGHSDIKRWKFRDW